MMSNRRPTPPTREFPAEFFGLLKIPLWQLLRCERSNKSLKEYCHRDHSDEHFDFVMEAEALRTMAGSNKEEREEKCFPMVEAIFAKFRPGAAQALTWDPNMLRSVKQGLETKVADPFIFNAMQQLELSTLNGDILPRFYTSKEYKELTAELLKDLAIALLEDQPLEESKTILPAPSPMGGKRELERSASTSVLAVNNKYKVRTADFGFAATFGNVLGQQILREYMVKDFSEDNLDFCLAVEVFRSRYLDPDEAKKQAQFIFNQWLDSSSKKDVTYPASLRPAMMAKLKDPWPNAFDEIDQVVNHTIRTDVFRRFIKSKMHHDLMELLKDKHHEHTVEKLRKQRAQTVMSRRPITKDAYLQSRQKDAVIGLTAHSFADVLVDPEYFQAYVAFCGGEHSSENLTFWCAIQGYERLIRSSAPEEQLRSVAQRIYRTHIKVKAAHEIPISDSMRTAIEERLKHVPADLFESAKDFVFEIMKNDSGARFMQSQQFNLIAQSRALTASSPVVRRASNGMPTSTTSTTSSAAASITGNARSGSLSQPNQPALQIVFTPIENLSPGKA